MWDVFEQPWTLLGAAVIVLLVVLTVRAVLPEKKRWWQWLLPLGVAALAVALDAMVATDLEKINGLVKAGIRAAEQEDIPTIARLLSEDYEDSYHKSREAALGHCRSRLVPPAIEKVRKFASEVKITSPDAVATFTVLVQFDKDSFWARNYKPGAMVVLQFYLRKQSDGTWRVRRAEVLEVDKMAVTSWGVARLNAERGAPSHCACQSRTLLVGYPIRSSAFALGG
jgi:hypothetical protein